MLFVQLVKMIALRRRETLPLGPDRRCSHFDIENTISIFVSFPELGLLFDVL